MHLQSFRRRPWNRGLLSLMLVLALGSGGAFFAHQRILLPQTGGGLLPVTRADQHVALSSLDTVPDFDFGTSPIRVDFGDVAVGESLVGVLEVENASSQVQTVTLVLTGAGASMQLGPGDESFSLEPGEVRPVGLIYQPEAEESLDASLSLASTDPLKYTEEHSFVLVGEGVLGPAELVLELPFLGDQVMEVDHGQIVIGEPSLQHYVLRNVGPSPTTNGRVVLPGQVGNCGGPSQSICVLERVGNGWSPLEAYTLGPAGTPDSAIAIGIEWTPPLEGILTSSVELLGGASPLEVPQTGEAIDGLTPFVQLTRPDGSNLTDLVLDAAERNGTETIVRHFLLKNLGEAQTVGHALGLDEITSCVPDLFHNKCFSDLDGGSVVDYELQPGEVKEVVVRWYYTDSENEDRYDPLAFDNGLAHSDPDYQSAPLAVHTKADGPGPGSGSGIGAWDYPDEFGGARGLLNNNAFFSDLNVDSINRLNGNLVVTLPVGTPWQVGPSFTYGLSLVHNSNKWLVRDPRNGGEQGYSSTFPEPTNAGLGWNLSLGGELYQGSITGPPWDWPGYGHPLRRQDWVYVDGTGGKHGFGIQREQSGTEEIYFADDESNLRLRKLGPVIYVDLPSGLTQKFVQTPADCPLELCWRLQTISDSYGNLVEISNPSALQTKIKDSHDREILVNFKSVSPAPGEINTSSVRRVVENVVFQAAPTASQPNRTATWSFTISQTQITRSCPAGSAPPAGPDAAQGNLTVPFLDEVVLPGPNGNYSFKYIKRNTGGSCEWDSGDLLSLTSPTGGKIAYSYGEVRMPTGCETPTDTSEQETRTRGVWDRRVSAGGEQKSRQTFRYYLYDRRLDDPSLCTRANTMETHVTSWPTVKHDNTHYLRRDISFHNVTKTTTGYPPTTGQWHHRDYGLPISKNPSLAAPSNADLFLSDVVLECECPSGDETCTAGTALPYENGNIPSECKYHRKRYRSYAYDSRANACQDRAVEFGLCFHRARPLRKTLESSYNNASSPGGLGKWVKTVYEDFDGFGLFRKATTESNLTGSASNVATGELTDYYVWENGDRVKKHVAETIPSPEFPHSLALPPRSNLSFWRFGLYDREQSAPDGRIRQTSYVFDDRGFLTCQRTHSTLGTGTLGGANVAGRADDVTVAFAEGAGFTDGRPRTESWAGGDNGAAGTTGCDGTPQYRFRYEYDMNQVAKSWYLDATGNDLVPQLSDNVYDHRTGLLAESCDHSVSPKLCQRSTYDLLDRLVDRTANGSRGVQSIINYQLRTDGGVITVTTKDLTTENNEVVDVVEFTLDAFGRERKVLRKVPEARSDPRVQDPDGDWIHQYKWYTGHDQVRLVTGVYDEDLWNAMHGDSRVASRYKYTYDIHDRQTRSENPKGEWVETDYFGGLLGRQKVKEPHGTGGGSGTWIDTTSDHLGRPHSVVETYKNGQGDSGDRSTSYTYSEGTTTVQRGVQPRKTHVDGRGVVTWEEVPEKNGRITYQYDSRDNLTQISDNGVVLNRTYDRMGRLVTVARDVPGPGPDDVLETRSYDPVTGRVSSATRRNLYDLDPSDEDHGVIAPWVQGFLGIILPDVGPADRLAADVRDEYGYDSLGNVAKKTTRLDLVALLASGGEESVHFATMGAGAGQTQYGYDGLGRLRYQRYPSCLGGGGCDHTNGVEIAESLELQFLYDLGSLVQTDVKTDLFPDWKTLFGYTYHASGFLNVVNRHDLAGIPVGRDVRTEDIYQPGDPSPPSQGCPNGQTANCRPDLALPRVGSISTLTAPSAVLWTTQTYQYAQGLIKRFDGDWHEYDGFHRLIRRGAKDYVYDDYDNLLVADTPVPLSVSSSTNRIQGTGIVYDGRGNLTKGRFYFATYDAYGRQSLQWANLPPAPGEEDTPWDYQSLLVYGPEGHRILTVDRLPTDLCESGTPVQGICDPTSVLQDDFSERLLTYYGPGGALLREFRHGDRAGATGNAGNAGGVNSYIGELAVVREGSNGADHTASPRLIHLTSDHLGSVRYARTFLNGLTESTSLRNTDSYTAWGVNEEYWQNPAGQIHSRRGFAGHESDRNGLNWGTPRDGNNYSINMMARTYVAEMGRFFSVDPARDSSAWSLYAYSANDPINNVDDTGLQVNPVTGERGIETVPERGTDGRIRRSARNPVIGTFGNAAATRRHRDHYALDVNADNGVPIFAMESGPVTAKVPDARGSDPGNYLIVEGEGTGNRYSYVHLSSFGPGMEVGTYVQEGEVIGYAGSTGNANTYRGTEEEHVHIVIRNPAGNRINPVDVMNNVNAPGAPIASQDTDCNCTPADAGILREEIDFFIDEETIIE